MKWWNWETPGISEIVRTFLSTDSGSHYTIYGVSFAEKLKSRNIFMLWDMSKNFLLNYEMKLRIKIL